MRNNWTENMAARDAAFRAGKQAHATGADVVPEKFNTEHLRAHFLRGYDIAAWRAAMPRRAAGRATSI